MTKVITPKMKPLFEKNVPFYKTRTFKIITLVSFIIIIAVAVFLILGIDYSTQTLEKSLL